MAASTTVNGRTVVHRTSGGALATFPDVCLTPTPGGPVPIPYPNLARSADLADGTRTVTVDGSPLAVEDSVFARSTGDEPGTQKGVLSQAVMGEARFLNWSFDVKAEGKGVARLMDPMSSNGGSPTNTPPAAEVQPPLVIPAAGDPSLDEVHVLAVRFHYGPPNVHTDRRMDPALFWVGYRVQSAYGAEVHVEGGPPQYPSARSDVPDEGAYALRFGDFSLDERPLKGSARWGDVARFAADESKRLRAQLKELSSQVKGLSKKVPPTGALTLGLIKVRVDTARTKATSARDSAANAGSPSRTYTSTREYRSAVSRASTHLTSVADELGHALRTAPPVLVTPPETDEALATEWFSVRDGIGRALAAAQALRADLDHELDTYR